MQQGGWPKLGSVVFTMVLACGPQAMSGDEDGETGSCTVGAEGCACAAGSMCDAGLACYSDLCVDPLSMTTSTGPVDSDAEESSTPVDMPNGSSGTTGDACPGGGIPSEPASSSIWIANNPEGTVSKIDTQSGVELARYFTGPGEGTESPSHTSVNLADDVAVANHAGSLAKFAGAQERCVDQDGDGMIATSDGPESILPFGQDECLLWYVSLPWPEEDILQGPRPTAWDAGTGDGPCPGEDARVWTGWWVQNEETAYFRRFDGATGATLDDVVVPSYMPGTDDGWGPYSGAVDAEGNFWVSGLYGPLLRIDAVTLEYEVWDTPSSVLTLRIDAGGEIWMASVDSITHFDPGSETYDVYPTPNKYLRGLAIDRNGQLWAAGNSPCSLVQFDLASRTVINGAVPLPGCVQPVGAAIDSDGFVWVPDLDANLAYKVDPTTYASDTTAGLVQPYTYSDMTGAALRLVVDPP